METARNIKIKDSTTRIIKIFNKGCNEFFLFWDLKFFYMVFTAMMIIKL